jgi:MinD superfamily P-loop ATPase
MKQLLVISGKGGTGKTVVSAALACLAKNTIIADCDVDAADMHLILPADVKQKQEFKSGKTAEIDPKLCIQCGQCLNVCRFEAISKKYEIDPIACEGCGFCALVCPRNAVKMKENVCGDWFVSETRLGLMVHAKLGIAEENSGKLVSLVRNKAKELAEENKADWVIIDGAPGIGCPVIACLSGVDCALVVTEPTLSGLHDAKRVIEVAEHFKVPVKLVINKYDLNLDMTQQIEDYCRQNNIDFIGKISFDKSFVKAMIQQKTIIEYSQSAVKQQIEDIWEKIENDLAKD